jgi:hypothetical protein
VDHYLSGHFELRGRPFPPPQILERRGLFAGATYLVSADNAEVGVAGFVPCAVMERAGSIRHQGDQQDEERARESNEFSVTDMSHHAILRDCAADVKGGANKKTPEVRKTPGVIGTPLARNSASGSIATAGGYPSW